MLLGRNNHISAKLVSEISKVIPVFLVEYGEDLDEILDSISEPPPIIFVNLLDVVNNNDLPKHIKSYFPNSYLIAIHYFQKPSVIELTLQLGYDQYISMFEMDHEVLSSLNSQFS